MNLSRWLTRGGAVTLPIVVVGLMVAEPRAPRAQAAAPGDDGTTVEQLARTVEELQRTLDERDAVMAEMLRRMRELEQRLAAQPTPPLPAPLKPQAPEPPKAAEEDAVAEAAPPPPTPPAAAPGQIEVDEAAVATALERALVQQGALVLPPGVVQVQPSFSYTRRETDAPTLLGPQGGELAAATESRRNDLTAGLTLRLGLPLDSQLALSIPYRYRDTSTVTRLDFAGVDEESLSASGFGDLAVTVSKGLMRERGWRPDLIARATWDTDTGQSDDGVPLGSGFQEVTAGLTASKSQDPLVFVGSLSYSHAFEDEGVQPGDVAGFSLGAVLAASPETSLRFFLDQNFVGDAERGGREVPGSDAVISLLSIGASSILSSRVFLDFELGIGLTEAAPDYTIGVALPIRFNLPLRF